MLAEGLSCGLHRIERSMRLQALTARPRRRRLPPDLGERQATAVAPNVQVARSVHESNGSCPRTSVTCRLNSVTLGGRSGKELVQQHLKGIFSCPPGRCRSVEID